MAAKETRSVVEIVTDLAKPLAEELSLSLWDVEFKKEGSMWILRVLIDKEGGVSTDDCEALSRALDEPLDRADPISQSYYLEVGSAGIDRELKRPSDFAQFMGSEVEVHLYRPVDRRKIFIGFLRGYEDEAVTIEEDGVSRTFEKGQYSIVRLYPRF